MVQVHSGTHSLLKTAKPTLLGKIAFHLVPFRRRVVLDNMALVFGATHSSREIRALAEHFYAHLVRTLYENITMAWTSSEALGKRIRVVGADIVRQAAEKGKGILLLTGHLGNWELAPIAGMAHFPQYRGRFHVLRRNLVNKTFERILFKRFYDAGLEVIPKRNSIDRVLEALAKNEVVVFIMDQYAKPGKDGILVDFFGKKAGTFRSLAMVAGSTGAPVIPCSSHREAGGAHVVEFQPPIPWVERDDWDASIAENTRAYNRTLEKMVLAHPDQWLWLHKRWKTKV